jgi:hypothetical protein
LLVDIADIPATGSEGAHLLPVIQRVEAQAQVVVERVIGDGAFGSGALRAACANYPTHAVDLVSPLTQPQDAEVAKSAFQIDLEAGTATCPKGQTVVGQPGPEEDGQPTFLFTFPRVVCQACPLFERCVRSKAGPYVRVPALEAYLQTARRGSRRRRLSICIGCARH